MKELGINPKDYSYVSSDENSTTLKHKKGHELRIAHNVLSKGNQEILKALAKTPKTESNDRPYGTVIHKLADGGTVKEIHSETPEPGYTEPKKMAMGGTAYENNMPCLNPSCKSHGRPHPNCRCYGFAEGGKVESACQRKLKHEPGCEYADGGEVDTSAPPKMPSQDQGEAAQKGLNKSASDQISEGVDRLSNPSSWWAKGGPVPHNSPGMMSSEQPFAKGGKARKMYADGTDDQASQDDSAPMSTGTATPPTTSQDSQSKDYDPKNETALHRDFYNHVLPWVKKQMSKDLVHPNAEQNQDAQPQQPQDAPVASDQPPAAISSDQPAQDSDQTDPNQVMSQGPATPPNMPPEPQPPVQKSDKNNPLPQVSQNITPQQFKQAAQGNIMDEMRAWSQDCSDGSISPETYESLFAKKDTLGKIGTLFGLMASGFGSGLSHQPNMIMEMMNKQIQNDLEAQKTTSENRQNYIKLAQQHELNKANILTQATGRKLTEAETAAKNKETEIKAGMYMQRAAMAKQMQTINNMPEGLAKQNMMRAAAMAYQQMDLNNSDAASMLATGATLANFGDAGSPQGNESNYNNNQFMLRRAGQDDWANQNDERHVPSVGDFSLPVDKDGRAKMLGHQKLDAGITNLQSKIDQYATLNHYSPQYIQGQEEVRKLQADLREGLLGTVYREGEQPLLDQLISMPPAKLLDYKTKAQLRSLKQINDRDFNVLKDQYGQLGHKPGHVAQQGQPSFQEGQTGRDKKTGKPVVRRNGVWVPQ